MRREIKFRVWDKNKNRMSLVAKIGYADDGFAKTITIALAPFDAGAYPLVDGESGDLMQFTGLKDKNENEIYEGDILEFEEPVFESQILKCPVIFWEGTFVAHWDRNNTDGREDFIPLREVDEIEIIGNIYENPELLK